MIFQTFNQINKKLLIYLNSSVNYLLCVFYSIYKIYIQYNTDPWIKNYVLGNAGSVSSSGRAAESTLETSISATKLREHL